MLFVLYLFTLTAYLSDIPRMHCDWYMVQLFQTIKSSKMRYENRFQPCSLPSELALFISIELLKRKTHLSTLLDKTRLPAKTRCDCHADQAIVIHQSRKHDICSVGLEPEFIKAQFLCLNKFYA